MVARETAEGRIDGPPLPARGSGVPAPLKSCEKIIFSREFACFAGRKKENSTLLSMSEGEHERSLYFWLWQFN